MLTFDEPSHTYRYDGVVVPSVTQVLKGLTNYDHIPADSLERAQQEGKAVHYMVEADCKGIEIDLPAWMRGHREAWQKFKAEAGFDCFFAEHRMYHEAMRYAGTMDLVGEVRNINGYGVSLIDVKRSFYAGPAIGLQLAGYQKLLEQEKSIPKIRNRFALQLNADGKYRLTPFKDPSDASVFTACVAIHNWKVKNGKHD